MSRKTPGRIVFVCAAVMFVMTGCQKSATQDKDTDILISQVATIEVTPTVAPTPIPVTPAPGITITPTATPKVEKEEQSIETVPPVEDNTEMITEGKSEITVEEAKKILESVPKDELGLKNEVKDYLITPDDWTTVAGTDICYCFNLYEQSESEPLIASFYVSTDGLKIMIYNEEDGEFQVIKSFGK